MQGDLQHISRQVQELHTHMSEAENRLDRALDEQAQQWQEKWAESRGLVVGPQGLEERVMKLEGTCAVLLHRL